MSGEKGFCPHKDPEYEGPSNFWCDDCSEIKDRIKDRDQRRYEIARDVMAMGWQASIGRACEEALATYAKQSVKAADALLAELEDTGR